VQALILAAGVGRRLGGEIPKPLLRVGGQTLIERLVGQLHCLGITQIVVVTGHRREEVEKVINSLQVQCVFNPHFNLSDNLVSFWVGQDRIQERCLMIHGDLIVEDKVLEGILETKSEVILPMDCSTLNAESMKIKLVEDKVVNLTKNLPVEKASGESLPLMIFSPQALRELKNITATMAESGQSRAFIDEAVFTLIQSNLFEVQVHDVTGLKWMEIDTPADLSEARRLFGSGAR
jgi:L-glutamine-phosphate cytidylyltransferase